MVTFHVVLFRIEQSEREIESLCVLWCQYKPSETAVNTDTISQDYLWPNHFAGTWFKTQIFSQDFEFPPMFDIWLCSGLLTLLCPMPSETSHISSHG